MGSLVVSLVVAPVVLVLSKLLIVQYRERFLSAISNGKLYKCYVPVPCAAKDRAWGVKYEMIRWSGLGIFVGVIALLIAVTHFL